MDELGKAYETADMLIALDLPISIDQLEDIERLEKEQGKAHREDLWLYFYEQCFANYTKRIINIKQAKIRGEVIVAKPVLLLAIIDGINNDLFKNNEFHLTEWLESHYVILMRKYTRKSQFDKPTDISNPFWHLQSDGFWHLQLAEKAKEGVSPSKHWLKDNVSYAYFDEDLWILLQNREWRLKLRDYIIEHKLTDGVWNGKMVADGFGIIVAILLAA
jgi:putative restriction endonuclease